MLLSCLNGLLLIIRGVGKFFELSKFTINRYFGEQWNFLQRKKYFNFLKRVKHKNQLHLKLLLDE